MSTFARPSAQSSWNASAHPRGGEGQFTSKPHTEAEVSLTDAEYPSAAGKPLPADFIDAQVSMRSGHREVTDAVAANIAEGLVLSAETPLPNLQKIANGEPFDGDAVSSQAR